MAILAAIPVKEGRATKAGLEAASYAASLAAASGTEAVAVVSGDLNGDGGLGAVGIARVLHHAGTGVDGGAVARAVEAAARAAAATAVVAPTTTSAGPLRPAPRCASAPAASPA